MRDKSTPTPANNGDIRHITTYQAGVAQATAHRKLQKYCDDVLKQYGITKMHWLIIGTVLDAGSTGVRLTDLADKLGTTMAYITNAVNLLQSKGMLTRTENAADSRSKLIAINKEFAPQCVDIEKTLRGALRHTIYAKVDPAEFKVYMKVMFQLGNVKPTKK